MNFDIENYFTVGFVVIFILIVTLVTIIAIKTYTRWRSLPTFDEYVRLYPHAKTNHGIKCFKCNSGSIKNWGLTNANDSKRKFICNHCGTTLYRI